LRAVPPRHAAWASPLGARAAWPLSAQRKYSWRSAKRGSANDPKAALSKWQKAIDHGAREIQGPTFSDVQSRPVQPLPARRICSGVGLSAKPLRPLSTLSSHPLQIDSERDTDRKPSLAFVCQQITDKMLLWGANPPRNYWRLRTPAAYGVVNERKCAVLV
jgi:hypothetical protein